MLQPAASSAPSVLSLTVGGKAGTAENPEIPEGFAALLALGMADGGDETADPDAKAEVGTDALLHIGKAGGKAGGKPGGNILPVLLPDGKAAADDALAAIEVQPAKPVEASADLAPTPQMLPEGAPAILAVALPVTAAVATPQIALPEARLPDASTPRTATTQLPLVATIAQLRGARAKAIGKAVENTGQLPVTASPGSASAETAIAATPRQPVLPAQKQPEAQIARAAVPAAIAQPGAVQPAATPAPTPPASPVAAEQAQPAAIELSVDLPGKRVAAAAQTAAPAAPATATLLKTTEAPAPLDSAAAMPAASAAPAAPAAPAARTAPPAVATAVDADNTAVKAAAAPGSAAIAAAATDLAGGDRSTPNTAEPQPILAMRDAQAAASANAPVVAPPSVQPAGHDFAALVDRLVDARDAAMPQAVRAAIQHAEFGQVSLNFHTDDSRLTVSMTSADPGFAPAVQAAAAMQANTSADSNAGSPRQDAQSQLQQQSGNSASGQAQSQSQGSPRGGERERADAFRQTDNRETGRSKDDPQPDGRGGIYA